MFARDCVSCRALPDVGDWASVQRAGLGFSKDTILGKPNYAPIRFKMDFHNRNSILMSLKTQIDADIKQAMLAKDKDALTALRSIKSLILLEETKEGSTDGDLKTEDELKLLTKAAKQRRESAEIFQQQNREDLATKELAELAIIERYMPKQLSTEELEAKVKDIISRVGATSPADMGKVMGVATKELAGQADGRIVSETVKRLLAK